MRGGEWLYEEATLLDALTAGPGLLFHHCHIGQDVLRRAGVLPPRTGFVLWHLAPAMRM